MILPLQGTAASQLWSWDPRPGLLGASPTPGPGKLRSQPDAGIRVLGLPRVEGTVWNITDTPGGQALRRGLRFLLEHSRSRPPRTSFVVLTFRW